MRALEKILLITGIICLALYGVFSVQAYFHQKDLERALERDLEMYAPAVAESESMPPMPKLSEGDLVGKLEIPRLNVSVMVMEGVGKKTLRVGAGHIPGTPYPGMKGNSGIAAHRDSYFRGVRDIKEDDLIRFVTPRGTVNYRVSSTRIVDPKDTYVLAKTAKETITLVTCYPFYYVGPAPKRFIVHATRSDE